MDDKKPLSRSTTLQELIDGGFIQKETVNDYFRIMGLEPNLGSTLFETVSGDFNNAEFLAMTPAELLSYFKQFCDYAVDMEQMEQSMDPNELEEKKRTARRIMEEVKKEEEAIEEMKRLKPTRH